MNHTRETSSIGERATVVMHVILITDSLSCLLCPWPLLLWPSCVSLGRSIYVIVSSLNRLSPSLRQS